MADWIELTEGRFLNLEHVRVVELRQATANEPFESYGQTFRPTFGGLIAIVLFPAERMLYYGEDAKLLASYFDDHKR